MISVENCVLICNKKLKKCQIDLFLSISVTFLVKMSILLLKLFK